MKWLTRMFGLAYKDDGRRLLELRPDQVELWKELADREGCTISELLDRAVAEHG